jgi:hypothetical protein
MSSSGTVLLTLLCRAKTVQRQGLQLVAEPDIGLQRSPWTSPSALSDPSVHRYDYIHIYIIICIYIHIYLHVYLYIYIYIYICIFISKYIYICIFISIYIHMYIHIDIYIYAYVCVFVHSMCVYTSLCVRVSLWDFSHCVARSCPPNVSEFNRTTCFTSSMVMP